MKLSKSVWTFIFALLVALTFFAFGFETWVKAEGVGWSFEARASATAELKRK